MSYYESIKKVQNSINISEGTYLVTGASGLVGRAVIDLLLSAKQDKNFKIIIYAMGRSEVKIRSLFGELVIPVIQDVCDSLDNETVYDYIIHGASNADPVKYATEPVETIMTNILGTRNILEYCRLHKHTRMVLLSSFEVYGKIESDEYTESDYGILDFHRIRNGYPESKRCAELLLLSYIEEYKVDAVIARLASIYGPTMTNSDSKAHAQFIRNAVKRENIILKSTGEQKRTYCYVLDAASAILTVLYEGVNGEAYNISNSESIATIAEVAGECARLAGLRVVFDIPEKIEVKGFSQPQNCVLNNEKLVGLGWRGIYSLSEGIAETVYTLYTQDNSLKK